MRLGEVLGQVMLVQDIACASVLVRECVSACVILVHGIACNTF